MFYWQTNHGLEIGGRGLSFQNEQAESRRGVLHRMCGQLARVLTGIPGAWVEDKGLTASVHFRGVEDSRKDEMASLVHSIVAADRDGLEVRKGNQVLEILPRVTWNKGSAVRWMLDRQQGAGTVLCYVGDDVTDEDVFRSMEGITIRVGEEGPTAARFGVRDPIEVAAFLRWLASASVNAHCLKQARDSAGLREPANNFDACLRGQCQRRARGRYLVEDGEKQILLDFQEFVAAPRENVDEDLQIQRVRAQADEAYGSGTGFDAWILSESGTDRTEKRPNLIRRCVAPQIEFDVEQHFVLAGKVFDCHRREQATHWGPSPTSGRSCAHAWRTQANILHRPFPVTELAIVADGNGSIADDRDPPEQIFDGLLRGKRNGEAADSKAPARIVEVL